MGQKVNPIGFRLGISTSHSARWYAEGAAYAENLISDLQIRAWLDNHKTLASANISRVEIARLNERIDVTVHAGRAGQIVGKKGENVDELRRELAREIGVPVQSLLIEVKPVLKPELDAKLVALNIARQLEQRVMFRRTIRRAMTSAREAGVVGIRLQLAGRLGGADIARTERVLEGRVPLHTLRAHIDYGTAEAHTVYGVIGIKVWIFLGDESTMTRRDAERSEAP